MEQLDISKMRSRRYAFALNNYTPEEEKKLQEMKCKFMQYSHEVGEKNGTPHLQGMIIFENPVRGMAMKELMPERAHFAPQYKCALANLRYTKKKELGEGIFQKGSMEQGKRNDWEEVKDFMKTAKTAKEIVEEYPEKFIKYHHGMMAAWNILKAEDELARIKKEEFPEFKLYEWEEKLIEELKQKPHPRKIIWYVDLEGGKGKSTFGRYLQTHMGALLIQNGRSKDLALMYEKERIVVFDFARTMIEVINYGLIEDLKNGCIMSTKYVSCVKIFSKPHIVVFSNFEPNHRAWTQDRWDIRRL